MSDPNAIEMSERHCERLVSWANKARQAADERRYEDRDYFERLIFDSLKYMHGLPFTEANERYMLTVALRAP